ncbi:MAG: helix-turn-helix domain-containing protein [Verrucomicrobiales bacterium]|nr:helix-turn-helix domain-containing protein [Verrucomicrobiales bacterium]MCP5558283.1 helix-turn-helix domain-containing protein [Verrucomicrobiaceae bacterium]
MAKKKSAKKKKPESSLLGLSNPQLQSVSRGHVPTVSVLGPEERTKVIERLKAGVTQQVIANDYGVTRQYISLVWKRYQAAGLDAVSGHAKRGRPKEQPLTVAEQNILRPIWQNKKPADFGLEPGEIWTLNSAKEVAKRHIGRTPVAREVAMLLKRWKIPLRRVFAQATNHADNPWDREIDVRAIDPELRKDKTFIAYLKSPEAAALREREKKMYEELVAKGKLVPKAKIGRPKKVQETEEAPGEGDEMDDFDMDLDRLDLSKLRQLVPRRPDPRFTHGIRTGKHGAAFQPPKKKKRKKR